MSFRTQQNTGSSTCVMEPTELQAIHISQCPPVENHTEKKFESRSSININQSRGTLDTTPISQTNTDPIEELPSPITATETKERWNHPRVNLWRTLAAFLSFTLMGSNDAAYGVCTPHNSLS